MSEFAVHPNVYATGEGTGLLRMLEHVWIRDHQPGDGTLYIVSGFGNYNGGVRFFDYFRRHIGAGGRIVSFLGGSSSQRLTSRQLVQELLGVRAEVNVVNRKRILHAKLYGSATRDGERVIVSSGNFTGPGMSLNIEGSISVDAASTQAMGFAWEQVLNGLRSQRWDVYQPDMNDMAAPVWRLLYDEFERDLVLDESEESTLIFTLSHADTARIQTQPGDVAGRGTQYFWLSRDCYGFFPPLTIQNERGVKRTFSCEIQIRYLDLGGRLENSRVTFEVENNVDFRLGTGPLRYTHLASEGELAALSRIGEADYELRLCRQGFPEYGLLSPYAVTFIGHRGKRYGYIQNDAFERLMNIRLGPPAREAPAVGVRPEHRPPEPEM